MIEFSIWEWRKEVWRRRLIDLSVMMAQASIAAAAAIAALVIF